MNRRSTLRRRLFQPAASFYLCLHLPPPALWEVVATRGAHWSRENRYAIGWNRSRRNHHAPPPAIVESEGNFAVHSRFRSLPLINLSMPFTVAEKVAVVVAICSLAMAALVWFGT
jgi:hypothetical protein